MNSSILSNKQQYAVIVLSVMLSLMVVWAAANGATTISTDVNTGGTLTVTGVSSLSSATLSTTLNVTGATTLSSASMSTTLGVAGLSTLAGVLSTASSTVSGGNLTVTGANTSTSGRFGVGTSSPAAALSASTAATTTLYMTSETANVGGCIQLKASNGTMYRMYIGGNDTVAFGTTTSGRPAAIAAVWEAGSCK